MSEEKTVPSKGPKKPESPEPAWLVPVLAFDDFVAQATLDPVRATGLEFYLRASTGLAPRPLQEWHEIMNHYQAQA